METLKDFMDKKAVADVLEQIAAFLELKGENPFRIRAFRTASRAIGGFNGDLRQGLEDGSLAAAKGVGPATLQIAAIMAMLFTRLTRSAKSATGNAPIATVIDTIETSAPSCLSERPHSALRKGNNETMTWRST